MHPHFEQIQGIYPVKVYYVNTVERLDNAPASIVNHLSSGIKVAGGEAKLFSRKGINILWHWAMSRLTDSEGLHSGWRTRHLVHDIQQFNPDVIHLHNIHGHYIDYPLLFRFLASYGRPVVWTLHDCWSFTGHCSHYTEAGCDRWQNGCGRCPASPSYPMSYIDRSARNFAIKKKTFLSVPRMHLVVPSVWLATQVEKSFMGDLPLSVISNGVDINTFSPKSKNNDGRLKLIAVAQQWSPVKGMEELQKIRRLLNPDESLELISGVTDREEMARIYSSADILLAASRQESFGMTPVEAMACGTPAIVNKATALPELVTPDTGCVIDFGDTYSAIRAIRDFRLRLGPELSKNCRERAVNHYDAERMTARYFDIYSSFL